MDDAAHTVEVHLSSMTQSAGLVEFIHRAAEESCCSEAAFIHGEDADGCFVMITTEVRGESLVKFVKFETPEAARRFRSRLDAANVPAGSA